MATWNSRGLRGSLLEEQINMTNERIREAGLGLVTKVPTPIKPIQIDKDSRHITLAYFDQKGTVDYIGVIQGIPVCFDAKECAKDTFPLANIHAHQIKYMADFEAQKGIAFLLVAFTAREELLYVPYREVLHFWKRSEEGGPKSFKRIELFHYYPLTLTRGTYINYLEALQKDILEREKKA